VKHIAYNNFQAASVINTFSCTIISSLAFFLCTSLTYAQKNSDNLINNPSFENNLSGWNQTEPTSISEHFRTGSKSLKMSGQESNVNQIITVIPNTEYVLEGYIKSFGIIGVITNGRKNEKSIQNAKDWSKATIEFNSGSATTVVIYANYYQEQGRYDDFSLTAKSSTIKTSSTSLTKCPEMGYLPIQSAFDDGSNDGNSPDNAIDGNLNNRWSSKGIGKTITFDLNRVAEVSQLDIMWYKGNQRISLFSVKTSIDGKNWSMVLSDSSSTLIDGYDSHNIESLLNPEAKLIQIIGAGNSSSEWNSISEIKIKGCVN